MEEACQRAQEHKHAELSSFTRWREGYSIFEAHCLVCGMIVRVDVNPAIGEPDLSGEALFTDCPGIPVMRSIPSNNSATSIGIA